MKIFVKGFFVILMQALCYYPLEGSKMRSDYDGPESRTPQVLTGEIKSAPATTMRMS
jgi:hypothetical protein